MEKIQKTIQYIQELAERYGAKNKDELNKDYVWRNNTGTAALNEGGAFFGFISPEEDVSGPYHDFSLVVFPDKENKPWLVCLGVGSLGFKNDYELAGYPGVRRLFSSIIDTNGSCKTSFLDLETNVPKALQEKIPHLKNTIKTYSKVLPVCEIVSDPTITEGQKTIAGFVAAYARLRKWSSNAEQKKAIDEDLSKIIRMKKIDDERIVLDLLKTRRFIVLQGAPGTGKTRLAKKIAKKLDSDPSFIQFHAETNYSDFIYGIKPNLNEKSEVNYVGLEGKFIQSIRKALENQDKKIVLIIDEINRANLSNILGPIFYLFEHKMEDSQIELDINGFKLRKLPSNYYVICTMNTADRSLAVVDFALRRRFAWYTLKPKEINHKDLTNSEKFFDEDFAEFERIFNWYATSDELPLQPGQAYFIASNSAEMEDRLRYELMPLIREYLVEGLLIKAKDEFSDYFARRLGEVMFE